MSMHGPTFERDELEAIYTGGGISRAELNHLLGERPGALSRKLTTEFIHTVGAIRKGDFSVVRVRGFLISAPSHMESIFLGARPKMESMLGERTSLAVLSPSPSDMTFALPAVVPRSISKAKSLWRARFVTMDATLLSLETMGGAPARFLLSHGLEAHPFDEFFAEREPALGGREVVSLLQDRFNLDFQEVRTAFLAHLFSAPPYQEHAGGTGLSLMACEERHQCLPKKTLVDVLKDLRKGFPAYMTKRRSSGHFDYLGTRPVPLRYSYDRLQWLFNLDETKAASLLANRPVAEAGEELSLNTRYILEMRDYERDLKEMYLRPSERQITLSVCDLPVLMTRDDLARDETDRALENASEDIAHTVVHSSIVFPRTVLEEEDRFKLVDGILGGIHREWPDLEMCMKRQVVFNLSAKGGLIEHATRTTGALVRACSVTPEDAAEQVQDMYISLFSRFYDVLEPQLRRHVAVMEKEERKLRERMESDLADAMESALMRLDAKYPDGWPYPELERLVLNRVGLTRAQLRKRFEQIWLAGYFVEVSPGIYKRVWGPDLFM
jgi:hypothetical protein